MTPIIQYNAAVHGSGHCSQSNDPYDGLLQWTTLTVFSTRLTSLEFLILTSSSPVPERQSLKVYSVEDEKM